MGDSYPDGWHALIHNDARHVRRVVVRVIQEPMVLVAHHVEDWFAEVLGCGHEVPAKLLPVVTCGIGNGVAGGVVAVSFTAAGVSSA